MSNKYTSAYITRMFASWPEAHAEARKIRAVEKDHVKVHIRQHFLGYWDESLRQWVNCHNEWFVEVLRHVNRDLPF